MIAKFHPVASVQPDHRTRRKPIAMRIWKHIDQSGGPDACWPWTASLRDGYGQVNMGGGRIEVATRAVWMVTHNVDYIPTKYDVCHSCDNPPCCNPKHLFLGTRKINLRDASRKGRTNKKKALSRLSASQVEEAKRLVSLGRSVRSIAADFGVAWMTVNVALGGKRKTRAIEWTEDERKRLDKSIIDLEVPTPS